jgi:hypothetical protein
MSITFWMPVKHPRGSTASVRGFPNPQTLDNNLGQLEKTDAFAKRESTKEK